MPAAQAAAAAAAAARSSQTVALALSTGLWLHTLLPLVCCLRMLRAALLAECVVGHEVPILCGGIWHPNGMYVYMAQPACSRGFE